MARFDKYECFGCHAIDGFDTERPSVPNLGEFARRPIEQIDFGTVPNLSRTRWDWLRHMLKEPNAFESEKIKLKMSWMAISDSEANAASPTRSA